MDNGCSFQPHVIFTPCSSLRAFRGYLGWQKCGLGEPKDKAFGRRDRKLGLGDVVGKRRGGGGGGSA